MKYKIGDKVLVMGELITIIEKIENGKYYFRDKEIIFGKKLRMQ
jgi:hypothetical protein